MAWIALSLVQEDLLTGCLLICVVKFLQHRCIVHILAFWVNKAYLEHLLVHILSIMNKSHHLIHFVNLPCKSQSSFHVSLLSGCTEGWLNVKHSDWPSLNFSSSSMHQVYNYHLVDSGPSQICITHSKLLGSAKQDMKGARLYYFITQHYNCFHILSASLVWFKLPSTWS